MRAVAVLLMILAVRVEAAPTPRVLVGDASPLGLPLSRFSDPALDDTGRIAFVGAAVVVFRRTPAGITRLLGAGDVTPSGRVAGVGPPALAAGCLAARVQFVGGGRGIFRLCDGALQPIALAGQVAPGGETFLNFGEEVAIAPDGRVAFSAALSQGATALLVGDGAGAPAEVVRTGGASPAGGTFTGFRLVGISAAGHVGFRGVVTAGRDGLFFSNDSALMRLAVAGDASPVGGSFTSIGFASMSAAGEWAFRATLADDERGGVFRADATLPVPRLEPVVLAGDPTPLGGTFQQFPSSLVPSIALGGGVAFRATLDGASAPSGAFVVARGGQPQKLVAAGEPTAAGALVRLREVLLAADGSAVVRASLVDGTPGLFVSRGGALAALARLGDATDLGGGFRFSDVSLADRAEDAVFLGQREGILVAGGSSGLALAAALGDSSPVGGTFAGFDPPVGGGRRIVFGATVQGGRVGEALFTLRRRGIATMVKTGARALEGTRLIDIFADPLDDLARAGVGRGGVAFHAALGGRVSGEAIVLKQERLRAVAVEGGRAPGGGSYRAMGTPAVVGPGRVAFVAEVGSRQRPTLVLQTGRRARVLIEADRETGTRIRGVVRTIDTPAAGDGGVAVRVALEGGQEGIVFAHANRLVAIAGTGEPEPGGGGFRTFRTPAVAGGSVVFRADLQGAPNAGGLYRVPVDGTGGALAVGVVGAPSPLGGVFVGFGPPSGNRGGELVFAAEISGGAATGALFVDRVE